jgi:hypothetical protein
MKPVQWALIMMIGAATPAFSGSAIGNACLSGGRNAASHELCGCLQKVADAVLSPGEQRRGAQVFQDPHLSQEIRMSKQRGDVDFWQKWQSFGATAQEYCN